MNGRDRTIQGGDGTIFGRSAVSFGRSAVSFGQSAVNFRRSAVSFRRSAVSFRCFFRSHALSEREFDAHPAGSKLHPPSLPLPEGVREAFPQEMGGATENPLSRWERGWGEGHFASVELTLSEDTHPKTTVSREKVGGQCPPYEFWDLFMDRSERLTDGPEQFLILNGALRTHPT